MRKLPVSFGLPVFLVLGLLGAWAGTGMGQVPPTPTVTLPTVTVPPAPPVPLPPPPPVPLPPPPPVPPVSLPPPPPVPLPPPPKVEVPPPPSLPVNAPQPPVSVPVTVPVGPNGTPLGSLPSSGQPGTSAPAGGGDSGATAGPSARYYGASSRIATVRKLRSSRSWVNPKGSAKQRGVLIRFWLPSARTVVFYVDQLSPECRYVGKFLVRGRNGRNTVRFRGRLGGRALEPGTYRLTARPRGEHGRRLAGVTIVVLDHPPGRSELAAARSRNTCPDGTPPSVLAAETAAAGASGDSEGGGGNGLTKSPSGGVAGAATPGRPYNDVSPGPLGAAADTIKSAAEAIPPVLFALAALAVLLLALASMPQPVRASRAGATLVHHRGTLALAGVGVLVGAVLSFALLP